MSAVSAVSAVPASAGGPSAGPRLRPELDAVPSYVPGRPARLGDVRAGDGEGAPGDKLSSNENPYPPLASVQDALIRATGSVNRYPDLAATELVAALAHRFGVPVEHVATGTGSVGVLQQLVQATAGPGDEVLHAWRSFEAYPIVTRVSGATSVGVPLASGGRHDLPAMAGALTVRTRLVLVCTPNNPTGAVVHRDELVAFLDEVPPDVLVVLDEAYTEFVRDPDAPDGLELYRERPNVAVLRTFSKAYGLAGLRVGFAIAHTPVADALRKTAVPFGVSGLAQVAAVASLAAEAELAERVDHLVAERERVGAELRMQGWTPPDSEANFVWLETGAATAAFAAACDEAGVVVRPFLGDGVRVTIGKPEANDRFLAVAGRWRAASGDPTTGLGDALRHR